MTIAGGTDVGTPMGAPTRPGRHPIAGRTADVAAGAGLLILVAGTFLPWLRSGTAERNSYSADGAIRSLLGVHGVSGAVLMAWPFVSLLCALAIGLLIVRVRRTGLALAALCALAAGIVCVRVLRLAPNSVVGVATPGPAVTVTGCAVVLAGAVPVLLRVALAGAAPSHRSRRIR